MAAIDVKWPGSETETENNTATAVAEPPVAEASAAEEHQEEHAEPEHQDTAPTAVDSEPPKETPAPGVVTGSGKPHNSTLHTVIEGVLLIAVIGLGLWAWGLHSDNADLKKQVASLNNNPAIVAQRETDALIAKVSALVDVPKDETPQAAVVSDVAKAKAQSAFFANAQNGDKILLYVKNGKAVLYRPSTNKVIEYGPLTINQQQTGASSTSTTSKTSTTTTKH
jgi:uncharacterized protein HemX